MTALAPNDAPALVKQWLDSFERRQDVNGFPLPSRPAMRARLTRLWMAKDGATTFAAWTPDLANAPFRLLAIVYRPDLGVVDGNGTIRSAGEARFVFTALDLSKVRPLDEASPLPFTVIFEYGLRASDRDGVKAWAERWHRLAAWLSAPTIMPRCRRSPTALPDAPSPRLRGASTSSVPMKASPCPGSCESFVSTPQPGISSTRR